MRDGTSSERHDLGAPERGRRSQPHSTVLRLRQAPHEPARERLARGGRASARLHTRGRGSRHLGTGGVGPDRGPAEMPTFHDYSDEWWLLHEAQLASKTRTDYRW